MLKNRTYAKWIWIYFCNLFYNYNQCFPHFSFVTEAFIQWTMSITCDVTITCCQRNTNCSNKRVHIYKFIKFSDPMSSALYRKIRWARFVQAIYDEIYNWVLSGCLSNLLFNKYSFWNDANLLYIQTGV